MAKKILKENQFRIENFASEIFPNEQIKDKTK